MSRRYRYLNKDFWFSALNKIRHAFLAADNGEEVDKIINAVLTSDEKMKIGRRIEIVEYLLEEAPYEEIVKELKVGKATVISVAKKLEGNKEGYDFIFRRQKKVESEFKQNAYIKVGPSMLLHKKTEYTGFKRKDVKR